MLILRKIVFYLFVAAYLTFCPLMILYSLGYTFKPGAEQQIVKGGLIYLSTAPPGASVYLGNRRYTKRTPAILPDLLPGDYPVKISLKKYRPWSATLPVEAGKATVLERILLLAAEKKPEELLKTSFQQIIPTLGNRFFPLQRGSYAGDLVIYDWKEDSVSPLLPVLFAPRGSKILALDWVHESSSFLLHLDSGVGEQFLWVTPRGREVQVKELTSLFPEEPEHIKWDPEEKKYLFSFQNGYLNRVDTVSKKADQMWLDQVRGFGLFGKRLYVLRTDYVVEQVDFEGRKEKVLLGDPVLGKSLFGEKGFYQAKVFSENLILFLGPNGELLGNRLPYRFVEEGVLGLEFHSRSKRLLIWRKDALGVLDFSKEREERGTFESGPRMVWVFKQGEKIEQAFWVYEGSHILFRDRNKVFLLELETYEKPHLYDLLEVKNESSIVYLEDSGKLYYLDRKTERLSAMEVLPRREIIPLPFPERREEKKKVEIEAL